MLVDIQCKTAVCPSDKKRLRLSDSGGLYLEVAPSGSKRWFWKYRLEEVEKRLALGSYPEVSLTEARRARDQAKQTKHVGVDPVAQKKANKLQVKRAEASSFREVASEWLDIRSGEWSESHRIRETRNLEKDLFPALGDRPISEIEPVELLATVRKIEARGSLDVAHRVLGTAGQVFRYGITTGRNGRDPSADLKGALRPHIKKNYGAITEPVALGGLLRAIQHYQGSVVVRAALKLAPILFQRPSELRCASWSEFNLDTAMWEIPAARMKRKKDGKINGSAHLVPLSAQAVEILKDLKRVTGSGDLVFPGERSRLRPISDNTLRAALQTMGYASDVQSVHGFRATARTLLDEELGVDWRAIEAQLAHEVQGPNGRAYDRTNFIKKRVEMMQIWADYLEKLCLSGPKPAA